MYSIEIPETINQLLETFYRLRLWSHKDVRAYGEQTLNNLHFILLVSFMISVGIGAYTANDKDEGIYLAIVTVAYAVLVHRLLFIIWRKDGFLALIQQIGTYHTEYRKEFVEFNNNLNSFMKFIRLYDSMLIIGSFPAIVVYPIVNAKHSLIFNIAFPLDRSRLSNIGFWLSYAYTILGAFYAVICTFFINLVWYLMCSLTIEYKLLGNQMRQVGTIRTGKDVRKISKAEKQNLFRIKLNVVIQTYERINGVFGEFESFFGNSLFLQVATGSACICGGLYALAFSSHDDLVQDLYFLAFLMYSIFDIFMVLYLGNEIKLASDELSTCLYESDWIEQTESYKKSIIILTERLKQPQQLVVGIIYPLNLETFTSIVNGAYTMFNILQSLRN
ncbi:odorant receptor 94a-like [Bradysia coprophila]|uniref:odorant receptor 94a-like n=1 Tax=Bradysia coprophila TaxID=38358 RepID=UPI00187D77C6|nr:odorant receptor 94a-like [Bradysia coprophila]